MWIKHVPYREATGELKALYERVKGPQEDVDNIMLAHSLRPHTMIGHLTLYKAVLHHPGNSVPRWFLEALGVYVSLLNGCDYCFEHHFVGMKRLLHDEDKVAAVRAALTGGDLAAAFDEREQAALAYAGKLTRTPGRVSRDDIEGLRRAGWEDGEILEINQVVAYFNYANRTALGLGVEASGDVLGLSPGESADLTDWRHR